VLIPEKARWLINLFLVSIIVSVFCGLTAMFAGIYLLILLGFERTGGFTETMRFGCGIAMVLVALIALWFITGGRHPCFNSRPLA